MNVLILSWRDLWHPKSGGAERITQKYASYWSEQGHKVFWLTNSYPNSKELEQREGVSYIRVGPQLSDSVLVNLFLFPIYYLKTLWKAKETLRKKNIDTVIDEIHGLPFLTPLFSKKRNILLACEVAGPIWDRMYPFPINTVGKLLERLFYLTYKNSDIWAISQSTKKDIKKMLPGKKVEVIPLGIDIDKRVLGEARKVKKTNFPSAVYLGRLVKMKGIETAIEAAALIKKKLPDFKLFVIGEGEVSYQKHLEHMVKRLGLKDSVVFLGFLGEGEKYRALAKGHFLIHPSYKEGFGLTVLEAAAVGTPTIARSGSSLDELVREGADGYLFNDEKEAAEKFVKGVGGETYKRLVKNALEKAERYEWTSRLNLSQKITKIG